METVPETARCQNSYLGKSGLRVSNICLGTMTFGKSHIGSPSNLSEADSHAVIQRFVQWGGNFLDTADGYGLGDSERVVGTWLKNQERDRFVVGTKFFNTMDGSNPNAAGCSRRHITNSISNSLQRLQTDYVDLYQVHKWDDATPIEETLRTLHDLVRCGKVRYLGASNFTGWQLQKVVCLTESMGLNPFISLQQQYSLMSRDSELEPFQVCKLNGVGVLTWSPLKGGILTGKYSQGNVPEEGRVGWATQRGKGNQAWPSWDMVSQDQQVWDVVDTVRKIACSHGKSPAQVALRWLLQKPVVTSVIVGASKMAQLEDNMGAANGWSLTEDEMSELDNVSKQRIPYPYQMLWSVNANRRNPWNPPPYVTQY